MNLTKHAGSSAVTVNNMRLSPDGKYVTYMTGSSTAEVLYSVPVDGSAAPVALTSPGVYLEASYTWTADSAKVIYGAGSTSAKLDLYMVPITGGMAKKIYATQSFLHIFTCGR